MESILPHYVRISRMILLSDRENPSEDEYIQARGFIPRRFIIQILHNPRLYHIYFPTRNQGARCLGEGTDVIRFSG